MTFKLKNEVPELKSTPKTVAKAPITSPTRSGDSGESVKKVEPTVPTPAQKEVRLLYIFYITIV